MILVIYFKDKNIVYKYHTYTNKYNWGTFTHTQETYTNSKIFLILKFNFANNQADLYTAC